MELMEICCYITKLEWFFSFWMSEQKELESGRPRIVVCVHCWHDNLKRNIKYLSFLFMSVLRDNLLDCWTSFVSGNKVCLIFLKKYYRSATPMFGALSLGWQGNHHRQLEDSNVSITVSLSILSSVLHITLITK